MAESSKLISTQLTLLNYDETKFSANKFHKADNLDSAMYVP